MSLFNSILFLVSEYVLLNIIFLCFVKFEVPQMIK
jgi:hypothetical protein